MRYVFAAAAPNRLRADRQSVWKTLTFAWTATSGTVTDGIGPDHVHHDLRQRHHRRHGLGRAELGLRLHRDRTQTLTDPLLKTTTFAYTRATR